MARDSNLTYVNLLEEMAAFGLGELAKEAAEMLEASNGTKAGSARLQVHEAKWTGDGPGRAEVLIDGVAWTSWDYKEDLYMTEELAALLKLPEALLEKRQCVTVAAAAGLYHQRHGMLPSMGEARVQAQQI